MHFLIQLVPIYIWCLHFFKNEYLIWPNRKILVGMAFENICQIIRHFITSKAVHCNFIGIILMHRIILVQKTCNWITLHRISKYVSIHLHTITWNKKKYLNDLIWKLLGIHCYAYKNNNGNNFIRKHFIKDKRKVRIHEIRQILQKKY